MRPGVRGGHPEDGLNRGCAQNNEARAAGKVGAALTPEPVIVELKAIVGSLLRVQAASHSAAPRESERASPFVFRNIRLGDCRDQFCNDLIDVQTFGLGLEICGNTVTKNRDGDFANISD